MGRRARRYTLRPACYDQSVKGLRIIRSVKVAAYADGPQHVLVTVFDVEADLKPGVGRCKSGGADSFVLLDYYSCSISCGGSSEPSSSDKPQRV